MGIAKLYSQSGGSGLKINGIIQDYYAYAGENISAGDFVEFVNGVAGQTTETSVDTVIDNTTANTTEGLSAVSLDEETAFIAYSATGSRYLYGVVCKIEGAKVIAGKITLLNAVTNSGRMISAVALDSSRVFIAHSSGGMLVAAVCSIEGLEVIYNTQVTLDSTSDASTAISASKLDDNKVFVAHTYSGKYYLYGIVCTINGIQIAPGSNTAVVNSISEAGIRVSTVTLNSSKVFMAHSYGATHFLYGIVCTISGTAITKGTDTKLEESSSAADRVSACTLDESKVFVAYYGGDYALNKIICTISNTTITPDTALSINTSEYCSNVISSMRLPDGNAVVFHSLGEDYKLGATVYNVEGEYVFQYILNSNPYTGSKISSVLLNNDAFVAHSNTSSYYLNAQLFGLEAGVPQTSMTVTQYETQVRKATTADVYGVAKTKGVGGDSTGHKDIVSIYTVEQTLAMLPVGTLVKDPSSTFLGEPVIWKIADVNHEGYPSNSVTLISDKILAMRCFDAMEPDNSYEDIQKYGYNNYSLSNIRQWLNSDAEAGQWYLAQQGTDTPPSSEYMLVSNNVAINPYDTKVGFLNGFSPNFKNALLETSLTVALNTVTDGGGSKTIADKMFLASNTEVGLANENNIVEGKLLSIFNDDASRLSCCTMKAIEDSNWAGKPADENTAWMWWLRTPKTDTPNSPRCVIASGTLSWSDARHGAIGVRPLCNISSSIKVTQDEDGIYKLDF